MRRPSPTTVRFAAGAVKTSLPAGGYARVRRGILVAMLRPLTCLLLPLFASCNEYRHFAPRESLNGWSASGQPAALYQLGDQGGKKGELRIWSDGARRDGSGGHDTTIVHVGCELVNTGGQPLSLDLAQVRLQNLTAGALKIDGLQPQRVQGEAAAVPGHSNRVEFWFDPGDGVRPTAISGFEVHWQVRTEGGTGFEQITPFAPYVRYHDPWYDDGWPYWRGGFGFG